MCIRIRTPDAPEPQAGPPPLTPRVEKDYSLLPKEKELVKPGDEKGVEFGSSKKQAAGIGTSARGTEALKIPLNTGNGGGTGVTT